jgi:hypothetical protein
MKQAGHADFGRPWPKFAPHQGFPRLISVRAGRSGLFSLSATISRTAENCPHREIEKAPGVGAVRGLEAAIDRRLGVIGGRSSIILTRQIPTLSKNRFSFALFRNKIGAPTAKSQSADFGSTKKCSGPEEQSTRTGSRLQQRVRRFLGGFVRPDKIGALARFPLDQSAWCHHPGKKTRPNGRRIRQSRQAQL